MREAYGPLLHHGDLVTDKAVVTGTRYLRDQIVVTSVETEDLITVGVILDLVVRRDRLLFILSLHEAVRTPLRFFQACPMDKVQVVDYQLLSDFKPLYKRSHSSNFYFFLHHHLPTPLR
jgi:adenylate kinase